MGKQKPKTAIKDREPPPHFDLIAEAMGWYQITELSRQTSRLGELEKPCRTFAECARLLDTSVAKIRLTLDMTMTQAMTGRTVKQRPIGRPAIDKALTEDALNWIKHKGTLVT